MRLLPFAVLILAIVLSLVGLSAATHRSHPVMVEHPRGEERMPEPAPSSAESERRPDVTVVY
jgi:hypothetical protein